MSPTQKRKHSRDPKISELRDFARRCGESRREMEELQIASRNDHVAEEALEMYEHSDYPVYHVKKAAKFALEIGALSIADGLTRKPLYHNFPIPVMGLQEAVELLTCAGDKAEKQAIGIQKVRGSASLAEAILEILTSEPGRQFIYKDLLKRLPSHLKEPMLRLREYGGDDRGIINKISAAVSRLRRQGHPIPVGRYVYGLDTDEL